MKPTLAERWPEALLAAAGATLAALSLTVMLGWSLGFPAWRNPFGVFGEIQYNTAFGDLILGAALLSAAFGASRAALALGAAALALGVGASIGNLLGAGFDADAYLFAWLVRDPAAYSGRSSVEGALFLTLAGIGAVILGLFPGRRRGALLLWLAAALALILGAAAAIDLASDWVTDHRRQAWAIGVALLVGTGPIVIGGTLRAFLGRGMTRERPWVRAWTPRLVAAGIIVGNFGIWLALRSQQQGDYDRAMQAALSGARSEIESRMEFRVQSLVRMAKREEASAAGPTPGWESEAALFVRDTHGVQTLMWAGPDLRTLRIVPSAGNEDAVGADLGAEPLAAAVLARARDQRRPALSISQDVGSGLRAFLAVAPIFHNEDARGYLVAVCLAQRMIDAMIRNVAVGFPAAVYDGDERIYGRGLETEPTEAPVAAEMDLFGEPWSVRVWPSADLAALSRSALANVTLVAGLVLALVLGGAVSFAQAARDRARELAEANWALQSEIRERRRAEGALAARTEELERSNKELDDFAYIASHDLKEPLRGIGHYATFLKEDYADKLDDEGKDRLLTLGRLTQRMEKLIDSLLEFSRAGRVNLAVAETDLDGLLHDVLDSLHVSLKERDVEVRVPDRLPIVACDPVRTAEALRNLITNAVKYNDKEEKWIEIGARDAKDGDAERAGGEVAGPVLYVRDNGIGIRDKHIEKIFQMFRRLHAQDKFGGGTGVGLALVKKILERQGGRIWVESEFGEGTTFYFTVRGRPDERSAAPDPLG